MSDAIPLAAKGPSAVHANARLTFYGRVLLVTWVRVDERPIAHVARELGVSRQCGSRWVARYDRDGWAGLLDRSSRPHHQPRRTPDDVEARVLAARLDEQAGPEVLAALTGVAARTITRILRRHQVPGLVDSRPGHRHPDPRHPTQRAPLRAPRTRRSVARRCQEARADPDHLGLIRTRHHGALCTY